MSQVDALHWQTVNLCDLLRDEFYQIRTKMDRGKIRDYTSVYRSAPDAMPPITVAKVRDVLILVDGWHRVEAMQRVGIEATNAKVVPSNETEARWLAAQANLTHGIPLKRGEIREAFRAYIRARKHRTSGNQFKSYRDIAADLGHVRSHGTIFKWMREDFPRTAEAMKKYEDFPPDLEFKDGPPPGDFKPMSIICKEHIESAMAAYQGIHMDDHTTKGYLIDDAKHLLDEMRKAYDPPEHADF